MSNSSRAHGSTPPARRPALTRAARRVAGRLNRMPRTVLIGGGLIALLGLAVAGYYFRVYSQSRAREVAAATAWRTFDDAAARGDLSGMSAALERLIESRPDDPAALARRDSLRTGSADPNDVQLAKALVGLHLERDRLPEAAREARKVLAHEPKHWQSLCVLSHHALRHTRNPEEARRWLDALPDPNDPATPLDSGGLLHALELCKQLDRDPRPFRRAIVMRVLPYLRSGAVEFTPPLVKAQLIDCYLEPFSEPSDLNELLDYWGVVSRLAHSAVVEAEECGDRGALVRLGAIGHRLLDALTRLQDHRLIPPDRFAHFAKELKDRTRRTWLAVLARESTSVEPYTALAVLAVRDGDYRQAVERLIAGLAMCGDRPELHEPLARLATATGNGDVAIAITRAIAEKEPGDPNNWCRLATAAHAAGRYEPALAACERARALNANHPWAMRIQVSVWLETAHAREGLDLLRSLGERAVRTDVRLVQLAVRALVETGDVVTAAALADELEDAERASGSAPVRTVAAIRGFLDLRMDSALAEQVAKRTLRLSGSWPDQPRIWRVLADAHLRQAELGSPPWDATVARTALHAYERLPPSDRNTPAVIGAIATLQLKSLNDPLAAWNTLAPFRNPGVAPLLGPGQREILGAACIATGRPKEAVAVLEPAVRAPSAPRGCWIQLAIAYHAAGRSAEARTAFARAAQSSARTAGERAEWLAAKQLLDEERP